MRTVQYIFVYGLPIGLLLWFFFLFGGYVYLKLQGFSFSSPYYSLLSLEFPYTTFVTPLPFLIINLSVSSKYVFVVQSLTDLYHGDDYTSVDLAALFFSFCCVLSVLHMWVCAILITGVRSFVSFDH